MLTSRLASKGKRGRRAQPLVAFSQGCGRLAFLALVASPTCLPGCSSGGYKGGLPPARVRMKVSRGVVQKLFNEPPPLPPPPPPLPTPLFTTSKRLCDSQAQSCPSLPEIPGDGRHKTKSGGMYQAAGAVATDQRALGIQIRGRKKMMTLAHGRGRGGRVR